MGTMVDFLARKGPFLCRYTLMVGVAIIAVVIYSGVGTSVGFMPEDKTIDFNNYPLLAAQIKKASKVVLYEGLPHQRGEPELLAKELLNKKTMTLHGYPFYQELLPLNEQDANRLTELFCDAKTLKPDGAFVAMGNRTRALDGSVTIADKACLGFHPDYCIEWQVDGNVYHMLVCFGCCTVKSFGPGITLRCDFESADDQPMAQIMKKYRQNRPIQKR